MYFYLVHTKSLASHLYRCMSQVRYKSHCYYKVGNRLLKQRGSVMKCQKLAS